MKIKLNAKVTYKMDEKHPDIQAQYIKEWKPNDEFEFEDTYTIETDNFFGEDDIEDYIKEDMLLVIGGGYDWEHVHNYKFEIKEV